MDMGVVWRVACLACCCNGTLNCSDNSSQRSKLANGFEQMDAVKFALNCGFNSGVVFPTVGLGKMRASVSMWCFHQNEQMRFWLEWGKLGRFYGFISPP
jgi:hypothetical protein